MRAALQQVPQVHLRLARRWVRLQRTELQEVVLALGEVLRAGEAHPGLEVRARRAPQRRLGQLEEAAAAALG